MNIVKKTGVLILLLGIAFTLPAQSVKELEAKKDPDLQLWGYENKGESSYWWKEAGTLGKGEELLNRGFETEWAISAQYARAAKTFSESLAGVEIHGKVGFIDKHNRFIIEPRFEPVNKLKGFSQGLAAVKSGGKYGFINKKGEFVIPPVFDFADNFEENLLATVKMGNKFGAVDLKGDTVIPCTYIAEEAMRLVPFSNKPYRQMVKTVKSRYDDGYYDEALEPVRAAAAEVNKLIRDTLYRVPLPENIAVALRNEKYGLATPDSIWVVEPDYEDIMPLADAYYMIRKDSKWGVADRYGRVILPCHYRWIDYQPEEQLFITNIGPVTFIENDLGDQVGLFNTLGAVVLPHVFASIDTFEGGMTTAWVAGERGIVDKNGQVSDEYMDRLLKKGDSYTGNVRMLYYNRLISLRPACAQAHNNLGIQELETGLFKEGMQQLKVAHELAPEDKVIADNWVQAKKDRKERRYNRTLNVLNTAGAVLGVAATSYSAATGTVVTVPAASGFSATDAATSSLASGSNAAKGAHTSSFYQSQYNQWERRAEQNYRSLTNLGTAASRMDGSRTGTNRSVATGQGLNTGNYTSQKKSLREAQSQMAAIRMKAKQEGIVIMKSEWETATVNY